MRNVQSPDAPIWARPQAITAIAHNLARLIYSMLKYGHDSVDKGMEFYQQRYQLQQINWIHKKAKHSGLLITVAPAPVAN
jgi:transposase